MNAPTHFAVVAVLLFLNSLLATDARAASANKIYVCIQDISQSIIYCISVGELSRHYRSRAIAIGREIAREANVGERVRSLDTSWLTADRFVGCSSLGNSTVAVWLTVSPAPQPTSSLTRQCAGSSLSSSVLLGLASLLFQAESDSAQFTADFNRLKDECLRWQASPTEHKAQSIAPTSGLSTFIGRIWAKIATSRYQPTGGSNGGVRGYCFADDPCIEPSCNAQAQVKAISDYLARMSYDGCNINATPTPDGPDECAKVKLGRTITPEELNKMRAHVCQRSGGVAGSRDGTTFRCLDPSQAQRDTGLRRDPCSDPAAMCTDDNVTPIPRQGFKEYKDELPPMPYLPPGFSWMDQTSGRRAPSR